MSDQDLSIPLDDRRPIPELLAAFYKFPLAYHDTDNGRFYAVQDWIIGVAHAAEPRKFWDSMKRRLKRTGRELPKQCKKPPYKAADGKNYLCDYPNAETLNQITQYMDKRMGIVSEVLTGMRYDKQALAHVYLVGLLEFPTFFKIGIAQDLSKRFENINTSIPFDIYLKHTVAVNDYRILERHLHSVFAEERIKGEWFSLDAEDVTHVERIMSEWASRQSQNTESADHFNKPADGTPASRLSPFSGLGCATRSVATAAGRL
jgi:Meiotically Up-regulated Gene 113 (MUG113) protein